MDQYTFSKDGINYVIVSLDYIDHITAQSIHFINLNLPAILKKRLVQDPSRLEQIMLLSPECFIFADTFNIKIVILCKEPTDNYCKIICDKLSEHIIASYENISTLLENYPEAYCIKSVKNIIPSDLICSTLNNTLFDPNPTEILPNLFIGEVEHSIDEQFLKEKNISGILTLMMDPCPLAKNLNYYHIKFLHIPINDNTKTNIIEHVPHCNAFIKSIHESNGNILVHCYKGISRSVSIVIAFLMCENNKSFNETFKFVQSKRPQAEPNFAFTCQLINFEKTLHLFTE